MFNIVTCIVPAMRGYYNVSMPVGSRIVGLHQAGSNLDLHVMQNTGESRWACRNIEVCEDNEYASPTVRLDGAEEMPVGAYVGTFVDVTGKYLHVLDRGVK